MLGMHGFRRFAVILATTGMLATGAAVGAAGSANAETIVPAAQTPFDFCNNTGTDGSSIACFKADIVFNSRNTFTLSHVELSDTAQDNRAVYALVTWNGGYDKTGTINGFPFTFENGKGAGTTATPPGGTHSASGGISYVIIALYASNSTSTSTVVPSNQRTNPFD
jgi:hypothetical protein